MLVTTVDKKIKFYQRVILMIMLVFMPFYSVGSDFFLEGFPSSSIEVVENGVHDVLDFDDNASLRTVRQEQIQIQQFVADFIADWLTIINVHELIHSLELQQCAFLPIFYQLHKTQSFVWFCSYLIFEKSAQLLSKSDSFYFSERVWVCCAGMRKVLSYP